MHNQLLKFTPATKIVASVGRATARPLAKRYV